MFVAACAASIVVCPSASARTEAEAADELIAVLGVTLPCPYFAVAWLELPTTFEYRCTPTVNGAFRLREVLPRERVGFIIDMQVARDRFASAYGFRGTPTPAVALARFLAQVDVHEWKRDERAPLASPPIVYSRGPAPLNAPAEPSQRQRGP